MSGELNPKEFTMNLATSFKASLKKASQLPGAIKRRSNSSTRIHPAPPKSPSNSLCLTGPALTSHSIRRHTTDLEFQSHLEKKCTINVKSAISTSVNVKLKKGQVKDNSSLSHKIDAQGSKTIILAGSVDGISGELEIGGIGTPIPFGVQVRGGNYAIQKDKHHGTVVYADVGAEPIVSSASTENEGVAAEVNITVGKEAHSHTLTVSVRKATEIEVRRFEATKALNDAKAGGDYGTLLAQITKARARFVESVLIDEAVALLKTMKPPESDLLTKEQLKETMKWDLVTRCSEEDKGKIFRFPCTECETCDCNQELGSDDVLRFDDDIVTEALKGCALPKDVPADQWLFEQLVVAAHTAPEGCVWRAGGKFILSTPNRNQAVSALYSLLGAAKSPSGSGGANALTCMTALTNFTEKHYPTQYGVTAIQVNFHPNQESYHQQHRDIYSGKQRGGANCTCSFKTCVQTVCYTLGSSRKCLTETCTDEMSRFKPCGDDCKPKREFRYLDSGCAMTFNDVWNASHTHGIPAVEEEKVGPRISIAFLMA